MSTAISTQQKAGSPTAALQSMLNASSVAAQFQKAMGKHSDAFCASLIELVTSDTKLQACPPKLLVAEALKAATMHLPLNKSLGQAYLVPFKDYKSGVSIPTMVVGYRGLLNLATRTNQYRIINADVVYEGELVGRDKVSGRIDLNGEKTSDKVIGFFAYYQLTNGMERTLYMSNEDMAKYAKRYSKSIKKEISVDYLMSLADKEPTGIGWTQDYVNMAKKTVVRQLLKYGPISIELQDAIAHDEDNDSPTTTREANIEQYANAQVVDVDSYEVVDPETGEIKSPAPEASADGELKMQF